MSSSRLWLRLLALAVIVDFVVTFAFRAPGLAALVPPLTGTILASTMCWSDAASTLRRRLLAVLATAASASLILGFVLAYQQGVLLQSVLLAILGVAGAAVCVVSWRMSNRRRIRAIGYYLSGPPTRSERSPSRRAMPERDFRVIGSSRVHIRRAS